MANLRFQVVEEAFKKKPVEVIAPVERPSEYFGKYQVCVQSREDVQVLAERHLRETHRRN